MSIFDTFNKIATTTANVAESAANTYAAIKNARTQSKSADIQSALSTAAKPVVEQVVGADTMGQANQLIDRFENIVANFRGVSQSPAPAAPVVVQSSGNTMLLAAMAFGAFLFFKK